MNIILLNIRGSGSLDKRRRINNLLRFGNVDFILLQ